MVRRPCTFLQLGAFLLLASISTAGICQHSPYTALEEREIKALSEKDIEDYREGRGMGFALAAELNGYPGPKHVLELADELDLSPAQKDDMSALFESMRSAAMALGEEIVEAEGALDDAFAAGTISPEGLEEATLEIGKLNGELRGVHLAAHLEARELLTEHQVRMYIAHRGYGGGHHEGMAHGGED